MALIRLLKIKILELIKNGIIYFFLKNKGVLLLFLRSMNTKQRPAPKYFSLLLVLAMFHHEDEVKDAADRLLYQYIGKDKWKEIKLDGTLFIKDYLLNTSNPFNKYFNLNHFQFWCILLSELLPNVYNNQVIQLSSKNFKLIANNYLFPNLFEEITDIGLRLEGGDSLDKLFYLLNHCPKTNSIRIFSDKSYNLSIEEFSYFNKRFLLAKNFEIPLLEKQPTILNEVNYLEWIYPKEIYYSDTYFPNTIKLDLLGTKVQKLDLSITAPKLTEIILSFSEQTNIPDCIYKCTNLDTLHIHDSNIQSISPKMIELEKLSCICLQGTKFEEFPVELMLPPNLEFIYNLGISNLADFRMNVYPNLGLVNRIHFSKGNMIKFPYQLSFLENLKSLTLANNQISEIDNRINDFKSLESLNLEDNNLEYIPYQLSLLKKLKNLNMVNNQISEIDNRIVDFEALESLDLGDNNLEYISDSVMFLPNLKNLSLYSNKILDIPFELIMHINKKGIKLNLKDNKIKRLPTIPEKWKHLNLTKNNGKIYLSKGTISNSSFDEYNTIFGDKFIFT